MACKYNVYQVVAFRMLAFSIVSILVNAMAIAIVVTVYEDVQFLRAFTISITALFTFSIIFLYALMKKRSTVVVAMTVVGWMVGNLILRYVDYQMYSHVLANLPLFVYAIILASSIYIYLKSLNKLIHFKQTEGVF